MQANKRVIPLKRAFRVCVMLGSAAILIFLFSALTFDRMIEYKQVSFYSAEVPAWMEGYKIAFITDTHALPANELEKAAERLNEWKPDLLVLGGDFPSAGGGPERSMEILSKVATVDGIYGVEGNHDNYAELFAAMEKYSVRPLSNSGVRVREGFYLAGVEDLWNRDPDVKKAAEGARPGDFVLLIAHNPDVAMKQDASPAGLVLSGHTHGGQITLFGLWAPALWPGKGITSYGQRFMAGWARSRDGAPVYVSRGAGTFEGVPRVFARPEVTLMTLRDGK